MMILQLKTNFMSICHCFELLWEIFLLWGKAKKRTENQVHTMPHNTDSYSIYVHISPNQIAGLYMQKTLMQSQVIHMFRYASATLTCRVAGLSYNNTQLWPKALSQVEVATKTTGPNEPWLIWPPSSLTVNSWHSSWSRTWTCCQFYSLFYFREGCCIAVAKIHFVNWKPLKVILWEALSHETCNMTIDMGIRKATLFGTHFASHKW